MNKPNIFFKKSISLICAALIAFGSIPVFGILNTVRADSGSKAEVKTFDFEPTGDGTKTVTSGRLADTQITSRTDTYNMNIWSVTADSEDTENNVLSIKMSDKDTDGKSAGYRVGAMVLNDGMQPYKLVPGEKYTVTMRYKVTNGGTGNSSGWLYFSQGAQTCSPADGTWGVLKSVQNAFGGAHADVGKRVLNKINYGNVNNKSLKDLNGTTVELNKWITFTYTFTARDCGNGNYIALASCVTPKSEILVDDICIAKSPAKAIAFDSNGGTSVKAIFGTGDAEITMPTDPKKGSLEFSGWYTDAALTKKFTLKKWSDINGDSVKLYAKWETAIIKNGDVFDFEGGDTAASGRIGGVQISSYDDETGKNNFVVKKDSTGNGVLEIRFPENAGAHYKNGTFILNKNGRVPELEAGKKYTVTMRVKINSLNQKATARVVLTEDIIIGNTGMPNEFGTVLGDSSIFTDTYTAGSRSDTDYMLIKNIKDNNPLPVKDINGDTVPIGEWHTITKTFTAYENKTNGNLYVGITACTGIGFSMYIDDIQFFDADKKIVSFNTGCNVYVKNMSGNKGEELTLPTAVFRDGYSFEGWYTDAALQNKASDKIILGDNNVTLYAKWKNIAGDTVDFEGDAYRQSLTDVTGYSSFGGAFYINKNGQVSHGETVDFKAEGCFGGESSLLVKYSGTKDYSTVLLRNSEYTAGLTAKPGKKYRITLKYKAANGNTAGAKFTVGTAASVPNGWYKVTAYENGGSNLNSAEDWQTLTLFYKNETDTAQYMHLRVDVTGALDSSASAFVDNVNVSELDEGIVAVAVDNQDGKETAFYFGKPGETLSIAAPEAREGFSFAYHATDKDGKNKFTASVFPNNDIVVYAVWEMLKTTVDFENYPDYWAVKGTTSNPNKRMTRFGEISDKYAYSGSKSLHIEVTEDIKSTDYTYVALDYQKKSLTLKNNTRYFVTFYYYAENLSSDLNVYFATANPGNIWTGRKQYNGNAASVSRSDSGAGWKKGAFVFTTDFAADNANALFLMTTGWSNGASVYFDNITVEVIPSSQSVVTFVRGDGRSNEYSVKNIGTQISFPEIEDREYYTFNGWYADSKFTSKFTGSVHTEADITVYGKWSFKKGVKINVDFEDYNLALPKDAKIVSDDKSGGSKSLYFDCGSTGTLMAIPLNLGNEYLTVTNGQRFAISFDYKLDKAPISMAKQLSMSFFTAGNGYSSPVQQKFEYNSTKAVEKGMRWWIRVTAVAGQWQQYSDTVTVSGADSGNLLYFVLHQGDTIKGYIDNITLTPLEDDDVVVTTDKFTTVGKPYYIGKKGQSYTLDTSLTREGNYKFVGWFNDRYYSNEITGGRFDEDSRVFASWALAYVMQSFEDYKGEPGYNMIGADYELYGPAVSGYNKANVRSGSYSLHRKGLTHLWENAQILNSDTAIGVGAKYTVSFWVKMDSSLHTDGAIRIVSSNSYSYPYDTAGDRFDVIAIATLADHEWHRVEYTFNSLAGYFSLQTPGYCSLYFDDIKFEYAGKDAAVSEPVKVEKEYEPLKRNPDGSLVEAPFSVTDTSLVSHKADAAAQEETANTSKAVILIVTAAAVVAAFGAVFIILKRKSIFKGKKSANK